MIRRETEIALLGWPGRRSGELLIRASTSAAEATWRLRNRKNRCITRLRPCRAESEESFAPAVDFLDRENGCGMAGHLGIEPSLHSLKVGAAFVSP